MNESILPPKKWREMIESAERRVSCAEKVKKICTPHKTRYADAYQHYIKEYGDGRCYE